MQTTLPQTRLAKLASAVPELPLDPEEIVSDDCLRRLARDTPERQTGEISIQDQAILAVILPDICGELLARRAAMRVEAS